MLGLLKLQEFAAQRGEGLIPELFDLLTRRPSPADASAEADAGGSNVTPLPQPRDPVPSPVSIERVRAA